MGPTYDRGERSAVLLINLLARVLRFWLSATSPLAWTKFQTLASLKVELVY